MPVRYDKRGPIGIVTLSRPTARNAWGPDFNEGLAHHFAEMEDDDEIRCAILTGDEAGGAFSAGANLKIPRPTPRRRSPRSSRASPSAERAPSRCWAASRSRWWARSTGTRSASAAS